MSPPNLAIPAGSPSGARAFGLRDLGLTWEQLRREAVGFGTVVWLRIAPSASALRTLSRDGGSRDGGSRDGGSRDGGSAPVRDLHIGETGQVPELQVENRGAWPLLLPAHVVLSGGWQTRAVERSVIVPGGGAVRVPVKCMEAGRWAPRDEQTARSFEVADRTGVRTRWSTSRSMADQLARHGRFAAEQATVWQQVDEELTRSSVSSRTRSYEAYLHGVKRRLVAEARRADVRPPLAANGVAIFPGSGGYWIEAYATPEALADHADDLLSDLFDPGHDAGHAQTPGAVRPRAADDDPSGGRSGAPDDYVALFDALWRAPLHPLEPLAGTVGNGFAISEGPEHAAGAALMLDGALAHFAAGAGPATREENVSGDRRAPVTMGDPQRVPAVTMGDPQRVPAVTMGDPQRVPQAPPASPAPSASPASPGPPASPGSPATLARPQAPSARPPGRSGPVPLETSVRPVVASGGSDSVNDRPRVDLETMRSIFGRARDLLPEGPPARDRVQGYRLVRVLDRNISWVDIRITGDGYAVLGSHDRCDLVLSNDAGVWLRHMAAICVRLEDDGVGLRLIDLKTDLPFFLDDDTARWSVLARGPFAMRLGRHVVCGFPIGSAAVENGAVPAPGGPPAAPASPPRAPVPRNPPLDVRVKDIHATGVLDTGTSINLSVDARSLPGPNELSSFVPSAPVSQIQDLLGPSASPNHIRVTLERGGMGASVELPTESLEAGVLLGRALNCFDGGLRRIFCEAISRAHVLLVRDTDGVFAFDLCSTNGTRVAGQRIRRYRLTDGGTTLELGKKVVFRWHRRE